MHYRYVAVFALFLSLGAAQIAFAQTECCCSDVSGGPCLVQFCVDPVPFGGDCSVTCNLLTSGQCPTGALINDPCTQQRCLFPLPVELASISATSDGLNVLLEWTTVSETVNAGFDIEHGIGTDVFEKVGYVEGAGTTTEPQSYTFRVDDLEPGTHVFRLKQLDMDGSFTYSESVEAAVEVPGEYVLEPAYPNPFNPSTAVRFAVAAEQMVTVALYDATGRSVRTLFEGTVEADGMQTIVVSGDALATGVYIVRLEGERFVASQEIVFVK